MARRKTPQTVPAEYGGKWIVWTKDALSIVGVGDTPEQAQAVVAQAGTTEIVFEWVPPADERFIGVGA